MAASATSEVASVAVCAETNPILNVNNNDADLATISFQNSVPESGEIIRPCLRGFEFWFAEQFQERLRGGVESFLFAVNDA